MQIEEGYRINAEVDNFYPVSDPDCVPLENSVLYILTSKSDLSCRNCNKGSCTAYCIGTIGRKLNVIFFRTALIIRIFTFHTQTWVSPVIC